MGIELLLSDVSHISNKYDLINKSTGRCFNIFDIANINRDEVCVCRFIYELINPKGSHYQGYTYLKLFVENVLNMKFSNYEYENAIVNREFVIKNGRRIDLVIEIADKRIPIEVKIYATDQNKQCYDYYNHYAKNSNVFYLTLDGRSPSKESAKGLTKSTDGGYIEVSQISFENDILNWLNKCLSHNETIKIASIREIILQFIGGIRSMTNLLVEEKEVEIAKTISSSTENIKNAINIEKSLKTCKINMVKKVLESIEIRLDNIFKEEDKVNEYSYKSNNYKLVNTYYSKASKCPGLSYFIKSLDGEGIDLLFRFEIDIFLYAGFCTPKDGESDGKQLDLREIREILQDDEEKHIGWWIYRDYLPFNDKSSSPNFREFNDAYFDLYDDNKFNEFIDLCEKSILSILEKIKVDK